MTDIDNIKEYSILFFRRRKLIAVRTISCTYNQVKEVCNFLHNEKKEYKKNSGKYTRVGFIENKPLTLREK